MALKRLRIIVALAFLATLFWIYMQSRRPNEEFYNEDETFNQQSPSAGDPLDPRILKDAHTLESADDFLIHFKAVVAQLGLTMKEAQNTCTWTQAENINFMFGGDEDWMKEPRSEEELQQKRDEWRSFVDQDMIPWKKAKSRFKGRGIAVVAGNGDSFQRTKVMLRALKKLGSRLPVEIHYWHEEMTPEAKKDLLKVWPKLYFNDLSASTNLVETVHGILINYQMKTAAIINSRFEEVLLLDSDNIPVIDPAALFESDTYYEYGTIFWPDIARTRPQNPIWPISNTRCRMDEYEQESGQVLVDKRRFFYHLQLAAWLNNVQGDYYKGFLLGDKDMFRFAWHMLKTQYGAPRKWLTSVGTSNRDDEGQFYCGHSFAQHHPNGSVAFLHGGLTKTMDRKIMRWNREQKGGIFRHYKRSAFDERHHVVERVHIRWDGGSYMPKDQKPTEIGSCTDMEDVQARDLDEIVPGFESVFEAIGGYWMLDQEENGK